MGSLEMFRGDTPSYAFIAKVAGSPTALDGLSVRFTAKRKITDDDGKAVMQFTVGNGITLDDLVVGRAVITVPAGATSGFTKETQLVWDLQVSDDTGTITTIDSGTLKVKLDVSRAVP